MTPGDSSRYETEGLVQPLAEAETIRTEIERYKAMMDAALVTPAEYEAIRVAILRPNRYAETGVLPPLLQADTARAEIEEYKAMARDGLIKPEEYEERRVIALRSTGLLD